MTPFDTSSKRGPRPFDVTALQRTRPKLKLNDVVHILHYQFLIVPDEDELEIPFGLLTQGLGCHNFVFRDL
jgi:hypothetical protein